MEPGPGSGLGAQHTRNPQPGRKAPHTSAPLRSRRWQPEHIGMGRRDAISGQRLCQPPGSYSCWPCRASTSVHSPRPWTRCPHGAAVTKDPEPPALCFAVTPGPGRPRGGPALCCCPDPSCTPQTPAHVSRPSSQAPARGCSQHPPSKSFTSPRVTEKAQEGPPMRRRVQGTEGRGNQVGPVEGSLRWVGTTWTGEHRRRRALHCLDPGVGSGQVRPDVGRSRPAVPEATPESMRPT